MAPHTPVRRPRRARDNTSCGKELHSLAAMLALVLALALPLAGCGGGGTTAGVDSSGTSDGGGDGGGNDEGGGDPDDESGSDGEEDMNNPPVFTSASSASLARRRNRQHYLAGSCRTHRLAYDRRVNGASASPVGEHLRSWRQRRRLSQLDLALDAGISARHLSFLETGRSRPSREMVLRLAERLEVPLRERNGLLVAAGFAPLFPERNLEDPQLQSARRAVDLVLKGHEPFPALAVDRHWTLLTANAAVPPLLGGADAALLAPPVNVLRLSLHPDGLAPRIANLAEWRGHVLERLRRQIDVTADRELLGLLQELQAYPLPDSAEPARRRGEYADVAVPFRIRTEGGELAFFSTTTVFSTPLDITLAELAIEAFFPADEATARVLWRQAAG